MNVDIKIKDNFLPKELFEKVVKQSTTLEYSSKAIVSGYGDEKQHVFLSNLIKKNGNLIKEIEKSIKKHFNLEIENLHVAAFTCVSTKKATPHTDASLYPNEKHMIIYLHGDSNLNSGTGFYNLTDENVYDLNTAVGFFPNRAVIFNADECWHSPLIYTALDNSPRFAIIVWFQPKK